MPKALVVDDEPDIRELLSMTLHQLGLEVTTAASLNEGISVLKAESFAVCITDMRLPDGNGITLVEYIQHEFPHLPVAMITSSRVAFASG